MIPHPEYKSLFFSRIDLVPPTKDALAAKFRDQPSYAQVADAIISRFAKIIKVLRGNRLWVLDRILRASFRFFFKVFHRLDIRGYENIPKTGAIFLMNHPGSLDPLIIMGAVRRPIGMFTSFGKGWFAHVLEKYHGLINREGTKDEMLEKMVRQILCHNNYFLIAPEGLEHEPKIQEGYTGVVSVYSVLNYNKNRIPIVPIILQNSDCYHGSPKMNKKCFPQIRINFLPPMYLTREWFVPVDQGGKTPREIINWIMQFLAHKLGQKEVVKNRGLEWRRAHPEWIRGMKKTSKKTNKK